MIQLLSREEALQQNETFASFIVDIQNTFYNPALNHNKIEPGEMYFEDIQRTRYISQEECDKLNAEQLEKFLRKKDNFNISQDKKNLIEEIIFSLSTHNIENYAKKVAEGILAVSTKMKWEAIVFLLEYPEPWLYQKNDFEPVNKALEYLNDIGVDEEFIGGIKADGQDICDLVKNLFWITRCNASLPTCYFTGIDSHFVVNICKYGNIHFQLDSKKSGLEIEDIAKEIGMVKIETEGCHERFSDSSAIEGRQIVL